MCPHAFEKGCDLGALRSEGGDPRVHRGEHGGEVLVHDVPLIGRSRWSEHVGYLGERDTRLHQPADPHQPREMGETVRAPSLPSLGHRQQPELVVVPDRSHCRVRQVGEIVGAHMAIVWCDVTSQSSV